jgi:hypothetical protein
MRTRAGFARQLRLIALTALAAGTIALLASARPVQAPEPAPPSCVDTAMVAAARYLPAFGVRGREFASNPIETVTRSCRLSHGQASS